MEKNKLTVIVPVYNVVQYLDKCIKSIVKQSYKNLEIILVDDGSTDNSSKICDEWAERDERIVVIHKKNGGLSDARNYGISKATGDYITFVDSDDQLDEKIYEDILAKMILNKNDIGCFNYCRIDANDNIIEKNDTIFEKQYSDDSKYIMLNFGNLYTYAVVAWNKIYRKEVFENLYYPFGKTNEDEFIIHKILHKINNIGVYNNFGYKYRIRSNSITNSYNKNRLDVIEALENRLKFITEKKLPNYFFQQTLNIYLYSIIQHFRKIEKYYTENDKKIIEKELATKFKYNINKLNEKNIRIQNRIKFFIFKVNPVISVKILNLFSEI